MLRDNAAAAVHTAPALVWTLAAGWGIATLVSGSHLVQHNLHSNGGVTWWGPIVSYFLLATMWGLIAPSVFRLARSFGDERRWSRRLLPVVTAGVAIGIVFSICRAVLHNYEHTPETRPCGDGLISTIRYLHIDVVIFATVFSVGLARRYLWQREAQHARAVVIEGQLAQARLAALQMQLNPHFLFNALNTISALVERDPAATRVVVARLSELLRRALDVAQRPEVTLHEELQFIRGYLEIMSVRFGDRLRTELAIDDGLDDALVPAFILQPLVENAFEHGIAQTRGAGYIELRVWRDGDRLRITVRDNGPGLPDTVTAGIGLTNTAARLDQLYPGRSALHLTADGAGGAVAEVELPYRTSEDA